MADKVIQKVYTKKEREEFIEKAIKASKGKEENLEFPDKKLKAVPVIELPIEYPLYNPDNTRFLEKIRDHVDDIENRNTTLEEAYDYFYKNRENMDIQEVLHEWSFGASKLSAKNIWKEIKTSKIQTFPIVIDSTGIVVDGNRRLSALRELFTEDPTAKGYKSFGTVLCKVIPGTHNRRQNQGFEKAIHRKEDLMLRHNWLNESIRIRQEFEEILKDMGPKANLVGALELLGKDLGKSSKDAKDIVGKAASIEQYFNWRKKYDKEFDGYGQLANEQIEQDMKELGSTALKQTKKTEKDLKLELAFSVVYGHTFGYAKYTRTYEIVRNINQLVGYINKVAKSEVDSECLAYIREKCAEGEKGIEKLAIDIQKQYEKTTLKKKIDKKSNEVLNTLKNINSELENLVISEETLLKDNKKDSLNQLSVLEDLGKKVRKQINSLKYKK